MNTHSVIYEAADMARHWHAGQVRKWQRISIPYNRHLSRVAGRALMQGMSDIAVAAAWLHDGIEDVIIPRLALEVAPEDRSWNWADVKQAWDEEIRRHSRCPFSPCWPAVYDLVLELTNPSKEFPDWARLNRKALDRDHMANVSTEAKIIKCFDRIDNLEDIGVVRFKQLYCEESRQLHAVLAADVAIQKFTAELLRTIEAVEKL